MGFSIFGKKKGAQVNTTTVSSTPTKSVTDAQVTITKLREAIKAQEKRENHVMKKVEAQVAEAKGKMAKGDKRGALFAMKRKKMYEKEAEKISNVKMTLETQAISLESAHQNAETFAAMHSGAQTMKKIRNDVGIDKVDDIIDGMKEEMEMAEEVNSAIAQQVDPFMADEDDLLAELEGLDAADMEEQLLQPPRPAAASKEDFSLPSVPSAKLPQPALRNDEAEELNKLEAELEGLTA